MTFDPAHYPDEAAQEADRILDERDEAQEKRDRLDEKGPAPYRPNWEMELLRAEVALSRQQED